MFMGEYNHTIDAKGRLIVPAKFREALGDEFVVTRGFDKECLIAYDNTEWQKFEEKINELPNTNADARLLRRYFLGGAASCEVDKQGRILLPASLRELAGLTKDVVFVGMASHIEIWDKATYDDKMNLDDIDISRIADNLESMGLSL